MYHGTTPFGALQIIRNGFMPTIGAGADHLESWYGHQVACPYFAYEYETALQSYPDAYVGDTDRYWRHEAPNRACQSRHGQAGGYLLDYTGTCPVRIVFVVEVVDTEYVQRGINSCLEGNRAVVDYSRGQHADIWNHIYECIDSVPPDQHSLQVVWTKSHAE